MVNFIYFFGTLINLINYLFKFLLLEIRDWGLGIGDWKLGLGIRDWGLEIGIEFQLYTDLMLFNILN